jgi:hypothetical protein
VSTSAFVQATRRLCTGHAPGVYIGAIRQAFGEGEIVLAERIERYPAHYLVALWEPLAPGVPVLPRWPLVAAIASPDSHAALLQLVSHLPADAKVWLATEAVDWALIADIVRLTDRNLSPYHHVELERLVAQLRSDDEQAIRSLYSDRDEPFEAMKQRWLTPPEQE